MVDNNKQGIEKILRTGVVGLCIAIVAVVAMLAKFTFLPAQTAPRTSVEKQLFDAQKALRKNPNDTRARLLLAYTYTQIAEYKKAEHEYLQVLTLDKKSTKAFYLLAYNYEKQGDINTAISTYKKIEDYDAALYQLGRLYFKLKKYDDSIKYLKKSLENDETSSSSLYYIGMAYEKTGKTKEAVKSYKEALKYVPDFNLAKNALVKLEKKEGK